MAGITGDYFEVFKKNGHWYWRLHGSHHPPPVIACSARSYQSKAAANKAIMSAYRAMCGAVIDKKKHTLRIEE